MNNGPQFLMNLLHSCVHSSFALYFIPRQDEQGELADLTWGSRNFNQLLQEGEEMLNLDS